MTIMLVNDPSPSRCATFSYVWGGKSTITNAGDGKASEAWSISRTAFE